MFTMGQSIPVVLVDPSIPIIPVGYDRKDIEILRHLKMYVSITHITYPMLPERQTRNDAMGKRLDTI